MQPSPDDVEVLLINPPYPRRIGSGVIPPINLCYLAAALRTVGAVPDIIDLAVQMPLSSDDSEVLDLAGSCISRYRNLKIVGIGPLVTATMRSTRAIVRAVRSLTNAQVIIGGPLCSVRGIATVVDEYLDADAYVAGDGEAPICAIWADVSGESSIRVSPGVGVRQSDEPEPFREMDLDKLPLPARDLIDGRNYLPSARRLIDSRRATASFLSRGCPYACSFCAAPLSSGRIVRRFSPERIAAEVLECANLGYEHLIFYDDCLFVKGPDLNQRVIGFADALAAANWHGGFQLELRCDAVMAMSDTALSKLAAAGCEQVSMGIEKGDAALLAAMRKRTPEGLARAACERLCDYSIRSAGTFILGGPSETIDDLERTVAFAEALPLDFAHFNPLALHPGTPLFYDIYGREARWLDLVVNEDLAPFGEILWRTEHLTLLAIIEKVREAYRRFYSPERLSSTLAKVPPAAHDSVRHAYAVLEQDRAMSWAIPGITASTC